jgi:hypothetical protein
MVVRDIYRRICPDIPPIVYPQAGDYKTSSMERVIGVSPFVGGLLGSVTCVGRPKDCNISRGYEDCRGENRLSAGVGGCSTNFIPAISVNESCKGLLVMVSARGDNKASSSGRAGAMETLSSVLLLVEPPK